MDSINLNQSKSNFLGLSNLDKLQKTKVYDIADTYRLLIKYLKERIKLKFAEKNLGYVLGVLSARNEYTDMAIEMAYYYWNWSVSREDFWEDFDWGKLDHMEKSLQSEMAKVFKIGQVSIWLKFYIGLTCLDWNRIVFSFAKYFAIGFVFVSVLYFLVATDWGRDLSWQLLDLYGVVAKFLMVVLLVIALIVIVVMVSFMYFERKSSNKF